MTTASRDAEQLQGISGSPGIAVGRAFVLGNPLVHVPRRKIHVSECDA